MNKNKRTDIDKMIKYLEVASDEIKRYLRLCDEPVTIHEICTVLCGYQCTRETVIRTLAMLVRGGIVRREKLTSGDFGYSITLTEEFYGQNN